MKIFLIRHGEQEYPYDKQRRKIVSSPNAPLVELGRIQHRMLGEKLAKEGQTLDALYTSPYLRARQSAAILADVLSISETHVIDGLKDDFPNSAEGRTYEELERIGGDIYTHPFSKEQESLDQLVGRARAAIEFILSDASKHRYNSVGIVGHGDPLCAVAWSIKYKDSPLSYDEMKKEYYPQKGEACEYTISDDKLFRLVGEGRIITTEAAKRTIESFRNPQREVEP